MAYVYLVHHAEAEPPGVDAMRPISSAGRATAARLALEAASRKVRPVCIWHSGKLRARQTAEVFWRACNPLAAMSAERGLLPGDPAQWMRDRLAGEDRDLMVVGHMPHLPLLLQLLLGPESDQASTSFPLHGVVSLEAQGECWLERWRLTG